MPVNVQFFERCFEDLIGIEGRYANDPQDSGGETMYGITIAVARAYGYEGPMREMPLEVAKQIYRRGYWEYLKLDAIAIISEPIARELFDTAVNCGQAIAGEFLQRALNAFNERARLYADIPVDGGIGVISLHALMQYFRTRGPDAETVLLRALNAQQGARYLNLTTLREKDERFVFGWFLNRVT